MSKVYSALSKTGLWDLGSKLNGHEAEAKHFMKEVPIDRDRYVEILECGVGTGVFGMAALRRFHDSHVTAVDLNQDMLDRFGRNTEKQDMRERVTLVQGHICAELQWLLKNRRKNFDVAIAGGLLEHLSDDQVYEMMVYVRDLLKDNGVFLHAAVRDTWSARNVLRVCRAHPPRTREKNIELVTQAGFPEPKILELPRKLKFAWIRQIKEAHLFQK